MELGLEMEDDAFFADLTQRISLLITEDDDDDDDLGGSVSSVGDFYQPIQSASSSSLYAHGVLGLNQQAAWTAVSAEPVVPFFYEATAGYRPRESCKGTGVFIPKSSSLPRRKSRSGRSRHNNNNNNNNNKKTIKTAAAASSTASATSNDRL